MILDAAIGHAIKALRTHGADLRKTIDRLGDFNGGFLRRLAAKLEGIALDLEVSRDRDARGAQP